MTVEEYILNEYAEKRFPFFSVIEIINKFGEKGKDELNKLFLERKIRPRPGMNGKLIELINKI